MKNFGLLGKNIDYSFSRGYFKDKFETHKLDCTYNNFDLETIEDFESVKTSKTPLSGLKKLMLIPTRIPRSAIPIVLVFHDLKSLYI